MTSLLSSSNYRPCSPIWSCGLYWWHETNFLDGVEEGAHAKYNHNWELWKVFTDALVFLNPLVDMILQSHQLDLLAYFSESVLWLYHSRARKLIIQVSDDHNIPIIVGKFITSICWTKPTVETNKKICDRLKQQIRPYNEIDPPKEALEFPDPKGVSLLPYKHLKNMDLANYRLPNDNLLFACQSLIHLICPRLVNSHPDFHIT